MPELANWLGVIHIDVLAKHGSDRVGRTSMNVLERVGRCWEVLEELR